MKFEIGFNKNEKDEIFEKFGAKWVPSGSTKYVPLKKLEIELNTFEELENLLKLVDKKMGNYYSAVISFDPPTIFLDKDV